MPANVTVEGGETQATFAVQPQSVSHVVFATISATLNGVTKNVALTLTPANGQTPDYYSVTDLGPASSFGGGLHNLVVNNSGDVAGTMPSDASNLAVHAFFWSHGTDQRVDLGTLPVPDSAPTYFRPSSYAFGMNDAGDVVGMSDIWVPGVSGIRCIMPSSGTPERIRSRILGHSWAEGRAPPTRLTTTGRSSANPTTSCTATPAKPSPERFCGKTERCSRSAFSQAPIPPLG